MIIFFAILITVALISVRRRIVDDGVWCNKCETDVVKGFFICWVVVGHSCSFIPTEASNRLVELARFVNGTMGQLVVVPFLFFSGYGVSESIRRKGIAYVRQLPQKRIWPTLLNFDVSVFVFSVLYLIYGGLLSCGKFCQALIGWIGVGNNNWYVFVILGCYLLAFVASIFKIRGGLLCFILVFGFSIAMSFLKIEIHWHNTMMAFPAGMLFSENRDLFERLLKTGYLKWLLIFAVGFIVFYAIPWRFRGIKYNIRGIFMMLTIVTLMFKFKFESRFLGWAGLNLFPIYLYHLLPMRVLSNTPLVTYPVLFATLAYCASAIIVYAYPKFKINLR